MCVRTPRPILALLALALALPTLAQEAPSGDAAPAAEKKARIRKGVQRVHLNLGYADGGRARSAGILSAPLTGEPGQPEYPSASPVNVELDGGTTFNLGYTYYFHDKWGIDLGLGYFGSQLVDKNYDAQQVDDELATTGLSADEKEHLRQRMYAHSRPHDMGIMLLDITGTRVFAAKSKWPFELGGGLGWAFPSLDSTTIGDRVVYERIVSSRVVNPQAAAVVANDIPVTPLPYEEQGCLVDNDPCIEMTEKGGLTWNVGATLHRAFSDKVMLDLGFKVRIFSQVVDPGDEFVSPEFGIGVSFLLGGD